MDVRLRFEGLPWQTPSPGIRFKVFVRGAQQVRLLELSEGFEETVWCTRAHAFYVIDGEFSLRLRDHSIVRMKSGDVGLLGSGEEHHHKAVVERGERACLLLFETL